jgi:glucokinase
VVDVVVTVAVSLATQPKPEHELRGLVWGLTETEDTSAEEDPAERFDGHELGRVQPLAKAAKLVRDYGERGDPLALKIFEQQAMALGRLFTIAANFVDPSTFFLGGGVVEAAPHFRDWFQAKVYDHTALREEQAPVTFALVPDRDMAGARGAAIAALDTLQTH